ncbi:hypothetical protein [Taklimakanibacter deserti]|uniref:hypothetical protein n=1 Tax=Taklimakanibacter deserti TaxID=2267839 RepID=UPI000E646896
MRLNPEPSTDVEAGIEELEAQRTVGLTRMTPADPVDTAPVEESSTAPETVTTYEIAIATMSNSLDGGQGVIEGTVEITEYVNDTYVSAVSVTSSVIVEKDTPLSLIEDRLLNSTRDTLNRLAGLSESDLRGCFDATKKDQDQAYQR